MERCVEIAFSARQNAKKNISKHIRNMYETLFSNVLSLFYSLANTDETLFSLDELM